MLRSDSGGQARILQEATYEELKQSFRTCPDPMYRLRAQWLAPCTLGESHTFNGSLQSLTLIYGSWDTDQPHVRVTTWQDLPDQDFVSDAPADLLDAPTEEVAVDVAGSAAPGTLVRLPTDEWLLRVGPGPLHLLASGRGPIGELSFAPLTDLASVINARRAFLASRYPQA